MWTAWSVSADSSLHPMQGKLQLTAGDIERTTEFAARPWIFVCTRLPSPSWKLPSVWNLFATAHAGGNYVLFTTDASNRANMRKNIPKNILRKVSPQNSKQINGIPDNIEFRVSVLLQNRDPIDPGIYISHEHADNAQVASRHLLLNAGYPPVSDIGFFRVLADKGNVMAPRYRGVWKDVYPILSRAENETTTLSPRSSDPRNTAYTVEHKAEPKTYRAQQPAFSFNADGSVTFTTASVHSFRDMGVVPVQVSAVVDPNPNARPNVFVLAERDDTRNKIKINNTATTALSDLRIPPLGANKLDKLDDNWAAEWSFMDFMFHVEGRPDIYTALVNALGGTDMSPGVVALREEVINAFGDPNINVTFAKGDIQITPVAYAHGNMYECQSDNGLCYEPVNSPVFATGGVAPSTTRRVFNYMWRTASATPSALDIAVYRFIKCWQTAIINLRNAASTSRWPNRYTGVFAPREPIATPGPPRPAQGNAAYAKQTSMLDNYFKSTF